MTTRIDNQPPIDRPAPPPNQPPTLAAHHRIGLTPRADMPSDHDILLAMLEQTKLATAAAERQAQALERIADLLTRAATEAGHDAP